MKVSVTMTGRTKLIMHNGQLSDPQNSIAKEIKSITDKGTNQTDADRNAIAKLEWRGGLYTDNGTIVMPMPNIIRAFREAAAMTKEGKNIARCLTPLGLNVPLIYRGHDKIKDVIHLYDDPAFIHSTQVKVGRGRIKRTRPCFPAPWTLVAEFELLDDLMNFQTLVRIVERTGLTTGLGDGRILGYGRFESEVAAEAKLKRVV